MYYILTFVLSFLTSYFIIPLLIFVAIKYRVVDYPHTSIKTHKIATPYLGGVAIWAGFVVALFIIRFFTNFPTGTLRALRGILSGATFMLMVGLIDDIKPIGFKAKFLWQIVGAIILINFDIRIKFLKPGYLADMLTILWVVGICNAVNIIDIMNGLASGISFIASLTFLFIAIPNEEIYVNFAAAGLAGGILGFLNYNFPKAKIFMGDAGSLFIGFALAAISLGTSYTRVNEIAIYTPILILGVPIYDTLYVMYLRAIKGKSPFLGSKDHLALRLESLGLSRKDVVLLLWCISVVLSFSAFLISKVTLNIAIFIYAIIISLACAGGWHLSKIKMD
ncbi:MAG: putative undecaprenyl-phosphate N-acetylglucosaminyl 1-phosphate transferase [Elusimicrobia bacterium ADurb.Bin231]|nr:MAG: putative undecaprenyl-phosphate N-acetylglucosaminyl 1-phosphate transferase [Elusimicrobia bacterium ADurb.Bin231]